MPVPSEYQRASEDFLSFLVTARDEAGLWSTHVSYTMTQGVSQAFRRRLSFEDAIEFANLLPAGLRALFVSDWDLHEPRETFDDADGQLVNEVKALRRNHNFSPDAAIQNVYSALRQHVDAQRLDEFLKNAPRGAKEFWEIG